MVNKRSGLDRRSLIKISSVIGLGVLANNDEAEAFFHRPEILGDEERNVVIIGSGFGGAVSALRLTQAGIPVTIIEKGKRWDNKEEGQKFSPNLYPSSKSTWLSNKTVIPLGPALPIRKNLGVLQGRKMAGFSILSGAAYGGGSICYGGVLKKPDEKIFKMVFPEELEFSSLEPHYQEVARRLNRGTLPADLETKDYWKHVRVMKKHCDRSGVETEEMHTATDWDIVRQEVDGSIDPSIIHGEAVYGVNSGAKTTLDHTYLKEAEDSGLLEVKTQHRVTSISEWAEGGYIIEFEIINRYGSAEKRGRILTKKLIMSAGTMGSNMLLVKARDKGTLPKLDKQVGTGWGNNGGVYGLRLGLESTGRWQGGPPSIGIKDYDNPNGPLFVEHPQLPLGIDIYGLLYFGIGINPTRGHFYYDSKTDRVELYYPKDDPGQKKINDSLMQILNKLNQDNGGFVSSAVDLFQNKVKDDAVYHPLGGCALGTSCDMWGRMKNYDGLYINDGSMLPGSSACTNPSFTIAAIAERNIEYIIANDF